jgi:hypothetical protein
MDETGLNAYFSPIRERFMRHLGEVIEAHSSVEAHIYSTFIDYCGIDSARAQIIIQHGRIKVGDMPKIVGALIDNAPSEDPSRDEHIKRALNEFERASHERNKLAHWQWAVGREGEQQILNLTKPKADGSHAREALEIEHLIQLLRRFQAIQTILYANAALARNWMTDDMRATLIRDALYVLS